MRIIFTESGDSFHAHSAKHIVKLLQTIIVPHKHGIHAHQCLCQAMMMSNDIMAQIPQGCIGAVI